MGSPAPAGIDPLEVMIANADLWFPRTRGDRPELALVDDAGPKVPPHPRG